ncbi:Qat anti-phage system TatD family nuclease QatD [Pseudoxanthomonas sp. PXM01]|uniref:Qat anti-phage system TatD family nuclease QatD n=1 Tax=Pseudoxanthomonas sp. PXM01 TaxID=2769295 RepID=UPI00178360AD|nr:Qat anti-phage system TatD family nuclease QatD [Pseudoxanthomonas sp. PXM01]MBD9467765.1 TatD family hydrolase [Pseudoxanthomonas sp. PXM01]
MNAFGSPRWVDFHCHLDLYQDHQRLVRECNAEKIVTLGVTTTPKAFARNIEVASGSSYVLTGLGLHPQLVSERSGELPLFEKLLPSTKYVGEVGLDAGPRFYASFQEQKRVFSRILRACDEQGGKILSIHSVRSVSKVIKELEENLTHENCVPVLHWFTGTPSEAARAIDLGCYFSINAEMISAGKNRSLLQTLPLERLLTETDGPFVSFMSRPARPTDVPTTVEMLAKLRGIDLSLLASQLVTNLLAIHSPNPAKRTKGKMRLFKSSPYT